MERKWKVSTTYKRAGIGYADIVPWHDQFEAIAKNVRIGDARFIVQACNAHNELVAALLEAKKELRVLAIAAGIPVESLQSWQMAEEVLSELNLK